MQKIECNQMHPSRYIDDQRIQQSDWTRTFCLITCESEFWARKQKTVMSFILGYFEKKLITEFYQNKKKTLLFQKQLLTATTTRDFRKLAVNSLLTAAVFLNVDLRPKFLLGPNSIIVSFLGIFY